ncbi:MAG: polyprenyl synthetase family protein [Lachnospiraceae bacterium]|nr:polyprenyl synthetase family protein [Lachnospiraceae bacterium]HCJ09369.1 farnesyl-diphosphate synthase [Lachnospiraceae bacterium]
MGFSEDLKNKTERIEQKVFAYMPKDSSFQKTVIDAMQYTMSAGGKRIRPMLMDETYHLFGGKDKLIEPFMAAIEMIHTYSLIHDDLPALDNDDYRRGRKTAHVVYGEAMAILAGDSLLNYAYETAAKAYTMVEKAEMDDLAAIQREVQVRRAVDQAMTILAAKPGIYGMIGGQVADVELTGTRLNKEQLIYIYENKTGALIEAAMQIGAVLAGASAQEMEQIRRVAYNVGMAFQIQDDILDETATFEELGKPIHSDEISGKVTYVTIHGIEASKKEVERLSEEAIAIVKGMRGDGSFLNALITYLIDRTN